MKDFLMIFIPRYITDRVALNNTGGVWTVVCLEGQERMGEHMFIHAYGTIKTFTWFGIAKGGMVKLDK